MFASPVTITTNTKYIISYHSNKYYNYNLNYFNSPMNNPPLHAVANFSSANGVYSYGAASTFPTRGAGGANFWVDVIFQ